MYDFVVQNVRVQLDAVVSSKEWLNSEFRFVRCGDPVLRDVCDVFSSIVSEYSIRELYIFWKSRDACYFDESKFPKYLSAQQSCVEANSYYPN
jgi:hypothetical protein